MTDRQRAIVESVIATAIRRGHLPADVQGAARRAEARARVLRSVHQQDAIECARRCRPERFKFDDFLHVTRLGRCENDEDGS